METQIIGVFNGFQMIGEDGKAYPVNSNYASKSKLNEGDKLKLTINAEGDFIYRQIERVATKRIRSYIRWVNNQCYALTSDGQEYRVLKATASFFKLQDEDEAILLVPLDGETKYAAVENVIKMKKDDDQEMVVN